MIKKEYVDYKGFKCLKITNGKVVCMVTVDVGPRIIYYGFEDKNVLFVDEKNEVTKGGEFFDKNYKKGEIWKIYGGHRLWKSEEDLYTYNPDNYPVDVQYTGFGASFKNGIQKCTGLAFELEVDMNDDGSLVLTHKIINNSSEIKKIAAWGITVLTKGGVEILPMPHNKTGFLPNRNMSLWDYTDINDSRISFVGKYLRLEQSCNAKSSLKLGIKNNDGYGFYLVNGMVFFKNTDFEESASYPDGGCNYETYTSDTIMEMETLSPLVELNCKETLTYIENWNIKPVLENWDLKDEQNIDKFVEKYIK